MHDRRGTSQLMYERLPIPALHDHVSCVWVKHVTAESSPSTHHTIPNGSAELFCVVGSISKLIGPQTHPTEEPLAPGTTAIGVRFRPGVAAPLLGDLPSELLDRAVDADDLWGQGASQLAEEVAETQSPEAALACAEAALLKRVTRRAPSADPLADAIVRRLLVSPGESIRALASSLYISERQLRRRCERATGMSPKTLHRVFRFQRFLALAHAEGDPRPNVGRLARETGYADQSHLSREAAQLTGRTPRAVLDDCRRTHDHSLSHRLFLTGALYSARSRRAAA